MNRYAIELKHFDNFEGGGCRIYVNSQVQRGCTAGGCGYDRSGTALGNWIEKQFQDKLKELIVRDKIQFPGVSLRENGQIFIDGGTGMSNMIDLLRVLGFTVEWLPTRSKLSDYYLIKG